MWSSAGVFAVWECALDERRRMLVMVDLIRALVVGEEVWIGEQGC